jgi:stage IV sporulation protein FB
MFDSGFLPLGRIRGAPIRAHWSVVLGALVFTGFRFEPGAWVGFVLLILCHELGHATLVMRYRLRVVSVDLHGFGGVCRWAGEATPWQRSVIAWGGVLAQLLVLGTTALVLFLVGAPRSFFAADLAGVFFTTNYYLIALNLLPFPPLDGVHAWKIFGAWRDRKRPMDEARREVKELDRLDRRDPSLSREDVERINRLFDDAKKKG